MRARWQRSAISNSVSQAGRTSVKVVPKAQGERRIILYHRGEFALCSYGDGTTMDRLCHHVWAALCTLVLSLYCALHTFHCYPYDLTTIVARFYYVIITLIMFALRSYYVDSTMKQSKAVLRRRRGTPKFQKAWTTAICRDHTAISRRPSNRGMVVESAMGVESVGPSEMGVVHWGIRKWLK